MTGLTLRPYQEEAITAVEIALERGVKPPLVVLPTGCHRWGQLMLMHEGSLIAYKTCTSAID